MISIICKPSAEVAPQVHLRNRLDVTGSEPVTDTFRNAEITIIDGGTAVNYYFVEEDFFQDLTVSNESGNSDISGYPTIRRNDSYEGEDSILLQRGDFKRRLNLAYSTQSADGAKASTGIADGDNYLRYSTEWLASVIDGNSAVYSGTSRNPSCWLAGEDLTGIPYSNTSGGSQKNSGMISPRHLPGVKHFQMEVGTVLTFPDGSTRTIIGVSDPVGDALMYLINADISAGTKVYPVPGRWLFITSESGVSFTTASQFVGVFVNRNRDASFVRVCDYESDSSPKIDGDGFADCATTIRFDALWPEQIIPEFSSLSAYRIAPNTGDSGSAIFFKVADGLALGAVFTSGLGGPFMDEDFANALIVSADSNAGISTGYTVTVSPDPTE